jgi:uncharacterized membrane protein
LTPLAVNWPISFDRPAWLWLMLAIPVIVAISMRSLAGLEPYRRIVAVTLRSLVIAALAIALARIEYVRRNEHVAVMFALDRSRSVPDPLRTSAEDYVRKIAKDANRDDRLGVIGFDGRADIDLIPSRGGFEVLGFGLAQQPDRTDLAGALRLAMAAFPQGFARRVVLMTDGNENTGNLADEVETARAAGVCVDVVPLEYQHDNEILFDRIIVPTHANRDTRITARLIVKSQRPAKAKLSLYHGDQIVPLAQPILNLTGDMKPDQFTIPIELHQGGIHRLDARLTPIPESADTIAENNRATAFTFVEDQGRVLLLTQKAGSADDKPLAEALAREKVDVEVRGVDQISLDLLKLQEYSVVMLSNVSADEFNTEQHKALASYVRDFGGGLIMIGGDQSLGAGGWIGKPVEEVSPVFFEVKHKKVMPKGALAIIMHTCEIPDGNRYGIEVATATVETLSSLDYLGVICYSFQVGGPNWDVPLAPLTNKSAVISKIKQMQAGDMPDFATTMDICVRDLLALKDASQRHMIIISDGDPAPPARVTIQKMIDNQITCSTVGIGYGVHVVEQTLRDIANKTGGRFYPCRNPKQLPQIFVKEAKVIRRPLIDEKAFEPQLTSIAGQSMLGISQAEIPQLGGLVLSTPKPDCLMPLERATSDGKDPVLAQWNFEMGKMAVFTSGWWTKWGAGWVGWEKFGKFWAQLVRWSMRQTGAAEFDIATRVEGAQGKIAIEALNKDASYLNFLRINGRVLTPNMEQKPVYLTQTGPGQYEGSFPLTDHGNYLVSLRYSSPDRQSGLINTGVSVPYSPEFRELGTNLPLLERAAERTHGRLLTMQTPAKKLFDPKDLPVSISRQPVWRWVVQWLLLPLFLLDVAARRLASALAMSIYVEAAFFAVACATIFTAWPAHPPIWAFVMALVAAESVGWAIRRRSIGPAIQFITETVSSHAGQRSAESLTQLKDVREKVRDDLTAKPQAAMEERVGEDSQIPLEDSRIPLSTPDPKTRFEVDEETAGKPASDLTQALGGADPAAMAEAEARKKREGQTGDMTSRLLRAKKRAQDQMKDKDSNE